MCCVMPPASPAATLVWRIASSSEVLPWSTCPMTVTTGARGTRGAAGAVPSFVSWAGARELQLFLEGDDGGLDPDFLGELDRGLGVERLVDRGEDAAPHEKPQDVLGKNAEFLRQLLDRDSLGEEDGTGRQRLLELQELARVMSAGLLGGAPRSGLGDRLGCGGGLFGLGALLDQGERDVGIRVFLVGADEFPQIDFVGDRDFGLRSPLLGGLLRLLLLFFLALGRAAAFRRGRGSDASGGRSARAAERRPPAWTPRLAGPRGTAAHGTSAWSAGCWMINGRGRPARAEPRRAGRRARARRGAAGESRAAAALVLPMR